MYCPKPLHGSELQLSKSRSSELYWEQAVSVRAPLNANEWEGEDVGYAGGSMC